MRHLNSLLPARLLAPLLSVALFSCSTAPKKPSTPEETVVPQIHYEEVQNRLGLDIAPGKTGFREKAFNACDLGPALQSLPVPLKDCRKAYFTLVRYQLSCRQDDQPEAMLTEADLQPVAGRKLRWTFVPAKGAMSHGSTHTDYRGEGVVRTISGQSLRRAHLKLSTGTDFLMFRANEATEVVTSAAWCR